MSSEQSKDSGLALVLICLIVAYLGQSQKAMLLAIILLVLAMTAPKLFRPFARVWFDFSHRLGLVMSKVILTILFFTMVIPVGFIRKALGKDIMQLKSWQNGNNSVFRKRDHTFTAADLDKPY